MWHRQNTQVYMLKLYSECEHAIFPRITSAQIKLNLKRKQIIFLQGIVNFVFKFFFDIVFNS